MGKKKILIIDDEVTLQKALTEALVQEGFEVFNAYNGEEGIKLFESRSPDLVLLDIIMPKIDGFGVFKKISQKNKKVPVMILSNLENNSEIQKMFKMGAVAYLIKSNFSLEGIVKKVKEIL